MKIDGRKRKRTPEELERLRSVGRKKGDPKVPGSGVKAISPDVKEALRSRTLEAVEVLADVMQNSSNDNARVKAAAYFLDPFVEKAKQTVDVNHTHSALNMLMEINQMRLKLDSDKADIPHSAKIIDVTPEPVEFIDVTPEAVEFIDVAPEAVEIIEPNTSPKLRVSTRSTDDV